MRSEASILDDLRVICEVLDRPAWMLSAAALGMSLAVSPRPGSAFAPSRPRIPGWKWSPRPLTARPVKIYEGLCVLTADPARIPSTLPGRKRTSELVLGSLGFLQTVQGERFARGKDMNSFWIVHQIVQGFWVTVEGCEVRSIHRSPVIEQ
jgi:hypothetical protein